MTVDQNPRVMDMIERALRENPDISNEELQERASEIDTEVGELSPRSFNARYPLQVKRRLSQKSKEHKPLGQQPMGDVGPKRSIENHQRALIRSHLIGFARDVVDADDRGDVIDVLRDIDNYVDEIVGGL